MRLKLRHITLCALLCVYIVGLVIRIHCANHSDSVKIRKCHSRFTHLVCRLCICFSIVFFFSFQCWTFRMIQLPTSSYIYSFTKISCVNPRSTFYRLCFLQPHFMRTTDDFPFNGSIIKWNCKHHDESEEWNFHSNGFLKVQLNQKMSAST